MYTLYLYSYNNYFNRILKKKATLQEYAPFLVDTVNNNNFVPNDGISAEAIIKWEHSETPNYMIAYNDLDDTMSRWFIIESERTRVGQYRITLRRDCLADNLEALLDAPTFIEKATLDNVDPFIFNDEGMPVNQILQSQYLLKDEIGLAWIVAYIPHHETIDTNPWYNKEVNGSVSNPNYNFSFQSIEEMNSIIGTDNEYLIDYELQIKSSPDVDVVLTSINNRERNSYQSYSSSNSSYFLYDRITDAAYNEGYLGILANKNLQSANGIYDKLMYNNSIVKISDSLYKLTLQEDIHSYGASSVGRNTSLYIRMVNALEAQAVGSGLDSILTINRYTTKKYIPKLEPLVDTSAKFRISTGRRPLIDQPYDMLCFPYAADGYNNNIKLGSYVIPLDSVAMLNIATNLTKTWGDSVVYDIQLLPYCPVRDMIIGNDIILSASDEHSKFDYVYNENTEAIGLCIYGRSSSGSFNIEYSVPFEDDVKLKSMTEMYRLCSPNYSGAYELRPYENGGIDYINVDFTYLPYQPWIKLNPNFKYLNGIDNNDSRGLILGGNFSITQLSDAWANYQLNNVNYQATFDRQVKNMKFNYKVNKWESIVGGAVSGIGQSVGASIATGSVGTGVALGVANAAGLAIDTHINQLKFKEQMSYNKDMYNYNLQNVQALPDGLAKVTAFNYNSKYFPYVEYYTCTEEEKEAVRKKLKYNGMTVMRIGTINEYIKEDESFIQGQIIRMDNLTDDFHMGVEIADEMKRGIFVKRSDIE